MTEDEARASLADRYPSDRITQLERFVDLLRAASNEQSLIARSTFDSIWSRHILDSAQLIDLGQANGGVWLDVGSGGGLPGLVVAILSDVRVLLSDPRRKRIEFLDAAIDALQIRNAETILGKAQQLDRPCATISARAVATIGDLFAWTQRCVSRETRFVLPRGQSWASDLDIARRAWHGVFHVEHSLTDPASGIVIADAVRAR